MEASELVRAAMAAAGIPEDRPTELARRLGLGAYDSPKRVKRWLDGVNAPRFDETIRLLELAGWLNMSGGRPTVRAAPGDPLAELAENDAALLENQHEAMRTLKEIRELLGQLAATGSTAPRRSRRSTAK